MLEHPWSLLYCSQQPGKGPSEMATHSSRDKRNVAHRHKMTLCSHKEKRNFDIWKKMTEVKISEISQTQEDKLDVFLLTWRSCVYNYICTCMHIFVRVCLFMCVCESWNQRGKRDGGAITREVGLERVTVYIWQENGRGLPRGRQGSQQRGQGAETAVGAENK